MNYFTKDELEWLLHEIIYIKNNYSHTHGMSIPVQYKIQSLIDNYCEHKMIKSASVPECVKCGIQV